MPESKYFELNDDVGVSADGNLEPLVSIGVAVSVPTMILDPETGKQEIAEIPHAVTINAAQGLADRPARIVPGTRIVECSDFRVEAALAQSGNWHEVDPPSKRDAQSARKQTQDAREEAGTHTEDGEE